MTNQHLRNYKILQQLGEGGMATVYLAEHIDLGHKVAVKVLNKEFTYHQNIRNRFIDEAKKMVRMDHLNVVKVTDLINDPDSVAIVMEYVDGETLRDVLSKKKLNDAEIENYLKQMVAALEYVHSQGLVHRDVKPSNFIFNEKGVLKLTDFGISKSIEGDLDGHTQTSTAMSMGTPMYMSPEQVRSTKDVTHLSDIYSLGVVLWEMAAGKKPYDLSNMSAFDLQLKIVQEDLLLTGTKWDGVIKKATEKDETKRSQNINELLLKIESGKTYKTVDLEKTIYTEKASSSQNQSDRKAEKEVGRDKKRKRLVYFLLIGFVLVGTFSSLLVFKDKTEMNSKDMNNIKLNSEIEESNSSIGFDSIDRKTHDNLKDKIVGSTKNDDKSDSKKNQSLSTDEKNEQLEKDNQPSVKIGDNYGGGIVAYLFSATERSNMKGSLGYTFKGIIVAPFDQSNGIQWGAFYKRVSPITNSTDLATECWYEGSGKNATEKIMKSLTESGAASICANLTLNGFSDWYLPTIYEMRTIYDNRNLIGSFNHSGEYWTSTWQDDNESDWGNLGKVKYAKSISFKSGQSLNNGMGSPRHLKYYVRAIRYF